MGVRVRFHRGAWWVFIAHKGKRRAKKVGDRETASAVAAKIRERLALGDLGFVSAASSESFQTFADRWLKGKAATRKATTHSFYDFNLRLHLYPALGEKAVGTITRADCRELLIALRAKGMKRNSLYGVQRTLSAVLSRAVEDGLLTVNPAFRMGEHIGAGDDETEEIHPLTALQAQTFLGNVKDGFPEYYCFFLLLLRTGLRLGEAVALQWADVDLAARALTVRRNRTRGKLTSTKSKKRRTVDVSLQLAEELRRRLVDEKKASLKAGRVLPPWVFTTRDGEPLDADNLRKRVFSRILERAKLGRHLRIHDCRHTFATLLIQQGAPLEYVRAQLGHSSIAVTVDVYGQWVPSADRSAVDRLDATVSNPGATGDVSADPAADAK